MRRHVQRGWGSIFLWRLLILAAITLPVQAEPIRFVTWNAQSFTNSAETQASLAARLNSAALWLRELNPDVVLLQEVPNRETANLMAARLGKDFSVAVCSDLASDSAYQPTLGQVAILSRLPAALAWAGGWDQLKGRAFSGGFAFAVLRQRQQWISVHSVLFPRGAEGVALRAEAMRQLLRQISSTADWKTNRPAAHILGGTLNPFPLESPSGAEIALELASQAGFTSAFQDLFPKETRTLRSRGSDENGRTTDNLLTARGLFLAPATFYWGISSDHAGIVADWDFQSIEAIPSPQVSVPQPEPITLPNSPAESPHLEVPPPAEPSIIDNQLFGLDLKWWVGGLSIFTLMLWALILRRTNRRHLVSTALMPIPANPDGIQLHINNVTQEQLRREVRPHLLAWLKEKFIGGLLSQREDMIQMQNHASDRADELGRRVEHIQEVMQKQFREAEDRVNKLEHELAKAKAENRELIQVNLILAKRKLEEARKKVRHS